MIKAVPRKRQKAFRFTMSDNSVAKTLGLSEKQVDEIREAFAFFDR